MFVKNVNTAVWHDYRQMAVVEGFQGHQLQARRAAWRSRGHRRIYGEGEGQRVHAPPPTSSRRGYLVPLECKKTF